MSDELLEIMRLHHARIPSLKWQYYGNEHGTLYTYPAVATCGDSYTWYDPRVRYVRYRTLLSTARQYNAYQTAKRQIFSAG